MASGGGYGSHELARDVAGKSHLLAWLLGPIRNLDYIVRHTWAAERLASEDCFLGLRKPTGLQ